MHQISTNTRINVSVIDTEFIQCLRQDFDFFFFFFLDGFGFAVFIWVIGFTRGKPKLSAVFPIHTISYSDYM